MLRASKRRAALPPPGGDHTQADGATRWLVDGFNVLHVAILGGEERGGWWGARARERLLALARCLDDPEAEIWIVFDGRRAEKASGGGEGDDRRLHVVFAPSADEWVLARLRASTDPGRVVVVTADRKLAARACHRGARVVSPRGFAARCASASP